MVCITLSKEEWELYLLTKITWWLDYSDEEYITVATSIYGVKVSITHDKLTALEMKYGKRACILAGG